MPTQEKTSTVINALWNKPARDVRICHTREQLHLHCHGLKVKLKNLRNAIDFIFSLKYTTLRNSTQAIANNIEKDTNVYLYCIIKLNCRTNLSNLYKQYLIILN